RTSFLFWCRACLCSGGHGTLGGGGKAFCSIASRRCRCSRSEETSPPEEREPDAAVESPRHAHARKGTIRPRSYEPDAERELQATKDRRGRRFKGPRIGILKTINATGRE